MVALSSVTTESSSTTQRTSAACAAAVALAADARAPIQLPPTAAAEVIMQKTGDGFQELDALRSRIQHLEVPTQSHDERLFQRINKLETSLLELERQSLERAKVGMENLTAR